jgi:preprotein translocase subunit SecF
MGVYIAIRFDIRFGVAAIICLVHDVLFSFAFLALIGGEFSLITVAAFLMIIGYSINDTVVIYDRVRENMKKSRVREDFNTVLNRSLNQTLSRTILTGGCVMLILLSLILFGGEVIHDFALLLLVGTIIGTLSTLTVVPAVVMFWNQRLAGSQSGRKVDLPRPVPPVEAPKPARRAR